nr:hypothetical protein [Tanacetum cinerariifolium]
MNPLTLSVWGDEHLNTIPATKSDEFIKSCVENLVPNPSESEGKNGCDVPACFTTFSNVLFHADYESDSSDYQSCFDEDFPEEIFLNPLFEEEIIPMKIDQHHFNAESDLIESMLNHDSSIIPSSSKINSLLDEFAEFVFENSDAAIESFFPSPIPNEDSDSHMEEIDLSINPNDPMPPSIEDDDDDSERDILIHKELLDNYSLSLPVPIPRLMITLVSNQEKYLDLLPHRGLEIFHPSECPMMIHGKNIPILAVPLFHFYPPLSTQVKDKQKDKIGTKPGKKGKRGRARQCKSPVTVKKAEKEKKIQTKWTNNANPRNCI